jgi:hypothetical protein
MNLPKISNIMPSIHGLNLWTFKQKIKDNTIQRTSTLQLFQRIDLYEEFTEAEKAYIMSIQDGTQQQEWVKAHGKLSKTTGDMKSHSFVLQFQQISIESHMARTKSTGGVTANNNPCCSSAAVRDTSNNLQQLFSNASGSYIQYAVVPCANAPAGDTTYGILAGTGGAAPASNDYKIQTLIAQGIGSGQLQYQATAVGASGIVGANVDTIIARVVVNGSGGTITITEVGLVVALDNSNPTVCYFLIIHDAVNQAVNNGAVAILSYDIRTTT